MGMWASVAELPGPGQGSQRSRHHPQGWGSGPAQGRVRSDHVTIHRAGGLDPLSIMSASAVSGER